MRNVFIGVVVLFLLLFFIIGGLFLDLGIYKFFAPRKEAIRREVFENTRSYNQGKIQELAKLKQEYELAELEDSEIIKNTIRHKFSDYNNEEMPYKLKVFLEEIRGY